MNKEEEEREQMVMEFEIRNKLFPGGMEAYLTAKGKPKLTVQFVAVEDMHRLMVGM